MLALLAASCGDSGAASQVTEEVATLEAPPATEADEPPAVNWDELAWGAPIDVMAFDPNGAELLVGTTGGQLFLIGMTSHSARRLEAADYFEPTDLRTLALRPDRRGFLVDQRRPLDRTGNEHPDTPALGRYSVGAYSPDWSQVVTADREGGLSLANSTGAEGGAFLPQHRSPVRLLRWSHNAQTLLTVSANDIWLWDVESRTRRAVLGGPAQELTNVAWSTNSDVVAFATTNGLVSPFVVSRGWQLPSLAHPAASRSLSFSRQGLLATACDDGFVRLFAQPALDESYRLLRTLAHPAAVHAVAFTPDGRTLATGCDDGLLRFWDPATGELQRTLSMPSHSHEEQ